jgi:iron complex transport system substrate-binding protein
MNLKLQTSNFKITNKSKPPTVKKIGIFWLGFILMFGFWILMFSKANADVPRRIVSGMPSITEMLFALGLDEQIVGVTTNCNYPPQAKQKEKIGGFFLNLEKVVNLKPDMVVMLESAQKKDIKRFREYGLPVYTIDPKTVGEVMQGLIELGKITGKEEFANIIVRSMRQRLHAVKKRVDKRTGIADILNFWKPKRKKALVIVGLNPLVIAGNGTFINDMLSFIGIENIAGSGVAYPQFSFEKLVEENPQYIIIPEGMVTKQEIESDKRWRTLEAVRRKRVLFLDADILSRPGPRMVETMEKIAEFVYN